MKNKYLTRSLLFVPAHNEKYLKKAVESSADILLLDLEDSCQPLKNKVKARELINFYIKKGLFNQKKLFPRINERESGEMLKDLKALCNERVDGFMYPKAKTGKDTYFFGKLLEIFEREHGIEVGYFKIILLIETTSSIFNIQEIINGCKNRVIAVAFGHLDYLSDLQAESSFDSKNFEVARSLCAAGARSCDVIPIDTIHPENVHDLTHLEVRIKEGKSLGYEGMLCLNPIEIPLVNKYYSPSNDDIKFAEEVVKSYENSVSKDGAGVAIVNGKFVGPPIIKRAKEILKKNIKLQKSNNKIK